MWTASLSSSQPWLPNTRPTVTTVKAPLQMCLSAAKFKFKFRQRSQTQDRCHDDDHKETTQNEKSTGATGQAVLAAFKSIQERQQPPSNPGGVRVAKRQRKTSSQPQKLEKQLNGSDVLRALQKASVEKAKKSLRHKRSNKERDVTSSIGGDQLVRLDDHPTSDTSTGPLRIQIDWIVRLEELEKRLRDIMLLDF